MRVLARLIALAVLVYGAGVIGTAVFVASYAPPEPNTYDAIIVLGAEPGPKGELFGQSRQRYEAALALFEQGYAPLLAFTGNAATLRAPALAMAEQARADGLASASFVTEPDSNSTLQNALFTRDKIGAPDSVLLVSHRYHLPRAWLLFRLARYPNVSLFAADPDEPIGPRRGIAWEGIKWPLNILRGSAHWVAETVGIPRETYVKWLD